ncbi:ATP-binding cassette (ABC) Superfamily [Phytophthora palmivora]|uniref:ATP-binding cassette (ABC) Superfamily n=1 Tax=Phytophthora palmivora TaxID=4796 RepID=A0A2P4YMJ1_9STRA|nr:ATP-binding cassette (ABC) Superfamily [Phytophthora palmivora]
MPKKASTHGASAPSKSKTARSTTANAKLKDKAAPRKEARKAASEEPCHCCCCTRREPATQSLALPSPDDRPNPRFAYRDHSPGAGSPVFNIPMITGSESDGDSPGSAKDPSSSQDAPSQDAPADDTASSEAKAASTSSPAKKLSLDEGKARAQAAKADSSKRADEGAAAKKRAAPGSPTSEPSIAMGFQSIRGRRGGAVTEIQEISNDLDEQQERYQAAQRQGAPAPPTPVYPRGNYPPDEGSGSPMFLEHLKAPCGLNHGRTSRGAYERALVQVEPLFVNDIEATWCVLLAPHRIPLKEFTSLRKKPEDRGGLFPVWGYSWVQPENTKTQCQAEDLFWRWISLRKFTVQKLKELREDRLLSYVLDQRDLRIEFVHLIATRQLYSVVKGLRQQSKSSAHDEGEYGSVNPGTVHRSRLRSRGLLTPRLLIPNLNSLRAVNPEPVFRLPRVL